MELVDQIMQELLDGQTVYTTERGYSYDDSAAFLSVEDFEALDQQESLLVQMFMRRNGEDFRKNDVVNVAMNIAFYHHRALLEMAKHIEPGVAQKRKQDAALDKAGDELNWRDM